jgi:hypothetical protein
MPGKEKKYLAFPLYPGVTPLDLVGRDRGTRAGHRGPVQEADPPGEAGCGGTARRAGPGRPRSRPGSPGCVDVRSPDSGAPASGQP